MCHEIYWFLKVINTNRYLFTVYIHNDVNTTFYKRKYDLITQVNNDQNNNKYLHSHGKENKDNII